MTIQRVPDIVGRVASLVPAAVHDDAALSNI